jgi:hypothetical protein
MKIILFILYSLFFIGFLHCGSSKSKTTPLATLGSTISSSSSSTASNSATVADFKINGKLKSLDGKVLTKATFEVSNTSYQTNDQGIFSLFINKKSYLGTVRDSNGNPLGGAVFSVISDKEFPGITYTDGSKFKLEWISFADIPLLITDGASSFNFNGTANLILNEFAPGIPLAQGGDYVELYVKSGGALSGLSLCVRTTCYALPEVMVATGDYILIREAQGINDTLKPEGPSSSAWDFYGLPSLSITDNVIYLRNNGSSLIGTIPYGDGNGSWSGCGSVGITVCLNEITTNLWTLEGTSWMESEVVIPSAPKTIDSLDTIIRCPNGVETNSKYGFVFSSLTSDRTPGQPNTNCPGFHLISASPSSSTQVSLTFSIPPKTGANIFSNYKIYLGNSCNGNELSVTNASNSGKVVTLTTGTQTLGSNYTVCASNLISHTAEPLVTSQISFQGFISQSQLVLNEVVPAHSNSDNYIEIFVTSSGSTEGYRICVDSNCTNFPNRIVYSGDYIVFHTKSGSDDIQKSDNQIDTWDFFSNISLDGSDHTIYIARGTTQSLIVVSAIAIADGNGTWTAGNFIDTIISQGRWTKSGSNFLETDAIRKIPSSLWNANDSISKSPNGSGVDNLFTWLKYTSTAFRSKGSANPSEVQVGAYDLVINELRRLSTGSSHWIEIYNRRSIPIDLGQSGIYIHRFSKCDLTWSSQTANSVPLIGMIPANGYYLIANTAGSPGNEDLVRDFSALTDNNCIFLTKSSTKPSVISDLSILDYVGYGTSSIFSGSSPAVNLGSGQSLGRYPNGNQDSNNNTAFTLVPNCSGSPKLPNSNTCPDTVAPTISSVTPGSNSTGISPYSTIQLGFSEPMDSSTITTNTSNTQCSGNIQISSSQFSDCVQIESIINNGNTYTLKPKNLLNLATVYSIKITTNVKDLAGNSITNIYSSQFTTTNSTATILYSSGMETGQGTFLSANANTKFFVVSSETGFLPYSGLNFLSLQDITTTTYNTGTVREVISNDYIPINSSKQVNTSAWLARRSDADTNAIDARIRIYWFNNNTGTANSITISSDSTDTSIVSSYSNLIFSASPPVGATHIKIAIQAKQRIVSPSTKTTTAQANSRISIEDVVVSQ